MSVYGGIEAGGTKFVCTVGTGPDDLRAEHRFPTTTPEETIGQAIAFFQNQPEPISSLGVGSFGPVDVDTRSPTYGHVTTTPKPGWKGANLLGPLRDALGVPIGFDTDVNAAALGEHCWGAAMGLSTFVYLTIGTGIGGGGLVNGRRIQGLTHPEMGHLRVPRLPEDTYSGACPFHGDCWEGLAAGPAIQARWGHAGDSLPPDHEAWRMEARYIALGLVNLILALSPERILLGGGVMQQTHLFPQIRSEVQSLLNGYVSYPALLEEIDATIVSPALGNRAGGLGAIALAMEALNEHS